MNKHITETPTCPDCGAQSFVVDQLTFNRQTFDAACGDWSASYDYDYETEYPLRAVCQQCGADCTEALADRLAFYVEESLRRLGTER